MVNIKRHASSFKDPSGYIFESEGEVYRQVNECYRTHFDLLQSSGLYDLLISQKCLVPHEEIGKNFSHEESWYKTLRPQRVPLITYSYEWCFDQLKDAALLTLDIVKKAVEYGMILKDATAHNIQFLDGRAIFIDTLSFERYNPSKPWIAYRQFCQNFLFPLYLEHYLQVDIQKILGLYPDGIPVDVTSKLLPLKSGLSVGVWLHVYLQKSISSNYKEGKIPGAFSQKKLMNVIEHLDSIIRSLSVGEKRSSWSNYYTESISGNNYLQEKEKIFREMIKDLPSCSVLDIGANNGHFARILAEKNVYVIAIDSDSRSISNLYSYIKEKNLQNVYPLVIDIANPSPAFGFHNKQQPAFHERVRPDLVVALALLHHLVIGLNIPLAMIASYFNELAPELIIEFVPKHDDKVIQMLSSREDVFDNYTQEVFELSFSEYYKILIKQPVEGTHRTMYKMKRK